MQDKGKQPHHPDSHVFIETVTPQGNPLCILGDPEMSVETRQALGIMADLVYQMALKGQL
jgi:hypothetical protein